jgi:cytochrome b pre-mRNA-processing protein 6
MEQQLTKHYRRIASLWPKDPMRPERPFTRVPEFRQQKLIADAGQAYLQSESRNVNALYSLLDGRYSKKVYMPSHLAVQPKTWPPKKKMKANG